MHTDGALARVRQVEGLPPLFPTPFFEGQQEVRT